MVHRGSSRLAGLGAALLAVVTALIGVATAAASPTTPSDNSKTLNISLPGPFNGCTFLDSGVGPTSSAILDLVRPSAFFTSSGGSLYGAAGPIASAELTSLSPETVQYTIAPDQKWSNGAPFTGNALVGWWHRARVLSSIQSDGYRSIKSMIVSSNGLVVTATFSKPYSDWNLLFRDVEALGSATGCSLTQLVQRPSLGPYVVKSAAAHRIVLILNRHWPSDVNRFGRIVFSDGDTLPNSAATQFVNYTLSVDRAHVQALSSHPTVLSHIGSSSNIVEMTFAPTRALTKVLAMREVLSWSIYRQDMLNHLFGSVTFSPSVAASALYSQGQTAYPGGNGSGPSGQTTTSSVVQNAATNGLPDCGVCAIQELRAEGYRRNASGWFRGGVALKVVIGAGPSGLDQSAVHFIQSEWSALGIASSVVWASNDLAAAHLSATNSVDVAVFTRPTGTAVSYAARSWSGPAFADSFSSGIRNATINSLFAQASSIFNPVTASGTWLQLDQLIMNSFWVRPLFTSPSLLEWSNSVAGVYGSSTIAGLVDQVTNWSTTLRVTTPS